MRFVLAFCLKQLNVTSSWELKYVSQVFKEISHFIFHIIPLTKIVFIWNENITVEIVGL